jgi:tRNA G37 N-methylase TrmD
LKSFVEAVVAPKELLSNGKARGAKDTYSGGGLGFLMQPGPGIVAIRRADEFRVEIQLTKYAT